MTNDELVVVIREQWNTKHVVVIGDSMLDRYLGGAATRMSPEAPAPVIKLDQESVRAGGAGNVAACLAALGAKVTIITLTGDDEAGTMLRACLGKELVEVISRPTEYRCTTVKQRIFSGGIQIARLDSECTDSLNREEEKWVIDCIRHFANTTSIDAVVLSDYGKGMLTRKVCEEAIRWASEDGIPVIVDPKQKDLSRYFGASVICPNLKEFEDATGIACCIDDMKITLQKLVEDYKFGSVLVTMAGDGVLLHSSSNETTHIKAMPREVKDVCGAGDVVTSIMALGYCSTMCMEDAAYLANLAAGLSIEKVGAQPVPQQELLFHLGNSGKVVNWDGATSLARKWQTSNKKIVFVNGCFDIIHRGHVQLFQEAKKRGDKLIVAVNSDKSVSALKGPGHPFINEHDRLEIVAAMECVDAVIMFSTETHLLNLIELIRPGMIVKGEDYINKPVVGAEAIKSWGGEVVFVPVLDSSTRIIRQLVAET